MKANEITIGKTYMAKVSGNIVPVRVIECVERFGPARNWHGTVRNWRCQNTVTGREIVVKSCHRFRSKVEEDRA